MYIPDQEVRYAETEWSNKSVRALFVESVQIFEECRDIGNGHERHECAAKEYCVDERLDVDLGLVESEKDGAHQDRETEIHDDTLSHNGQQ